VRVAPFAFAADRVLTEHTSNSRALIHVLSGEAEFTVAGEPRWIAAGNLLHVPPNVPHAVRAVTAITMLLTLVPERTTG
jgi:quercetin dioxygenase-like cupin family protein